MSKKLSKHDYEVLNVIMNSKEPISSRNVGLRFGHSDNRKERKAIENLRKAGYPICIGTNGGYIFSDKNEDLRRTICDLESRIYEMQTVCDGLQECLV